MIIQLEGCDGTIVSIGRNAKGNDTLCKTSYDHHIWLHLHDHPSPHVVIHTSYNQCINKDLIKQAASFVKKYSKLRDTKRVKVVYCRIDNILLTKTMGMVHVITPPNTVFV